MKQTLVTSALPYANGYLHLGHIAGSFLPADLFVRYLRLNLEQVLYVCGSDEYGVAISIAAEKEHCTPQELVDKYHTANAQALEQFAMSFDIYSRTTAPAHIETTQEFFLDLLAKGHLAEKEEAQFYDEDAQMFLPDRYVEGTCPNCNYDKARGDQCDRCGAYYNQLDLKNPRSLVSGKNPIVRNTTHWYFKLGDFQSLLKSYIESHNHDWKDNVLQQARSWLNQGLGDRAITRDLTWGVPVPLDKAKGKVIYVWFDAVLGYITATKEWAKQRGTPDAWKQWWLLPDGKTQSEANMDYVAFLGKDNIVFHTIMFPAMLHAKTGYVLPTNVPANEFLNLEGEKFSKSRNWAIDLRDFLRDFPHSAHIDALRYTLTMNMPESRDSDFTWKDYQSRINNELAAILGNFIHRVTQFIHKYFQGRVPELSGKFSKIPVAWKLLMEDLTVQSFPSLDKAIETVQTKYLHYFTPEDIRVLCSLGLGVKIIDKQYRAFRFRDALTETMNLARAANKYFNDSAPWKSIKESPQECAKTLYICSQLLRSLGIAFSPVIPYASKGIEQLFSASVIPGNVSPWKTLTLPQIPQNSKIPEPEIFFSKLEDTVVQEQVARLGATPQISADGAATTENSTNIITMDDFKKIQLRTAKIISASRVPKSDKLLQLIVETGTEHRQILAGIGKYYTPESLPGMMVVIVANLKPAKLMGIESQGMILAANLPDGSLSLVQPDSSLAEPGAEVR